MPKLCSCNGTVETLPPEERARANFYSLLARLFYAPPDAALLEGLAAAQGLASDEGAMPDAWQALVWAAVRADVDALQETYESAFVRSGKPLASLHTTAYTPRSGGEVALVALRRDLARLGLARHALSREPEDHIASLCDAMRHLIQAQKRDLAQQGRFFKRWIAPAAQPLCDAIAKRQRNSFYEYVAHFAEAFFELERCAFEMFSAGTPRRFGPSDESDTSLPYKPGH
jgi:TorA maturation chaperone TorD